MNFITKISYTNQYTFFYKYSYTITYIDNNTII